jgi:pyruvate dehydrogenase E2 component (dihydrolipoamide acetyltransferase)
MAVQVRMPKLGMMEGDLQLVSWEKNEGDAVEKGDALAVVESQKITNEVEAPISGSILRIVTQVGETVPIGTVLAIIGEPGEDISALLPAAGAPVRAAETAEEAPAQTFAQRAPEEEDGDIVKASPVAKRLAREHGVSLNDVAAFIGSSRRLQGDDVLAFVEAGPAAATPRYTETKLLGMRKTIAERMLYSSQETAPVVLMRSVDITALKNLRDLKKEEYAAKGTKPPSINDLMMKAAALALEKHPHLNATFEKGVVRTYEDINFNMAIATDAGLITPVIKNINKLGIDEIGEKVRELSQKANSAALSGEDLAGGTFTVTNLGMLGIEVSTPILNPPQVAIIAFGTIQPYLALENGQVVERYKTFFSLTLDHRIIDGYPGALYLQTLAEILADPGQLWS